MTWRAWKGGNLPGSLTEVVVRVKYRNGVQSKETLPAGRWARWKWGDALDDWDIVEVERVGEGK